MATNISPPSGSYVLNKFPSISQWSDTGPSWPSCETSCFENAPLYASAENLRHYGYLCFVHVTDDVSEKSIWKDYLGQ